MNVKLFLNEIHDLSKKGIISQDTVTTIHNHYLSRDISNKPPALVAFSIIGSLLIGLGAILIFAHNWYALSRTARIVISFLPLIMAQALTAWILLTGKTSRALREGTALFYAISVGIAIALIAQTYHLGSDFGAFLLMWAWLTVPIIYLLGSVAAMIIYLIGICAWSGYSQSAGGDAMLFWVLFAVVLPYCWQQIKTKFNENSTSIILWAISWCLTMATGIVLEKVIPGLWIVVYAGLFSFLYFWGVLWKDKSESLWAQPFLVVGGVGNVVLAFILTHSACWEDIGWDHFRNDGKFHLIASIPDYILAMGLPVLAIYLLSKLIRKREYANILLGLTSLLGVITFVLANAAINTMIFNVFTALIGIGKIVQGIRNKSLSFVNIGMVILIVLIAAKFFDSSIDFVVRGVIFMVLGVLFLGVNIILARNNDAVK